MILITNNALTEDTYPSLKASSKLAVIPNTNLNCDSKVCKFLKENGINPGQEALIINGRLISPLKEPLSSNEIEFLLSDQKRRAEKLRSAAKSDVDAINVAILSGLLGSQKNVAMWKQVYDDSVMGRVNVSAGYPVFDKPTFTVGDASSPLQFVAMLDPLSDLVQKWSSILVMLSEKNMYLRVYLSNIEVEKMPLQRFYRFVDREDKAVFNNLPEGLLLTMGYDGIFFFLFNLLLLVSSCVVGDQSDFSECGFG